MATYVNDLRLKEIATGDESGTWGTSTNTNLELIAEAMGVGAEAVANASTHTITMADGATDQFRSTFLRLTGGGQACTVTLAPNTLSHTWIMRNETAAALTLTQGSGANVAIAAGQTKIVATDGAGSGAIVYEMDDLELAGNLLVGGTLGVTGVLTATSLDISGDIDVDGTTNLDVVDIDGAVNMATTALVTGVLTTTAATVFNGGFASNAASTITTADNTDTLSLISTDADASFGPNIRMYRNSGSPADNDLLGNIEFEGRNDNSQDVVYGRLFSRISDASDGSEDGIMRFDIMKAGSLSDVLTIKPDEIIINDGSYDYDFRVESNDSEHALFVQGSDGKVGIGVAAPAEMLEIFNATGPAIQLNDGGEFKSIFRLAGNDLEIRGSSGSLEFYNGSADGDSSAEAFRITAARDMYFGQTSGDAADVGHIMQANGIIFHTADGAGPLELRRLTSDGPIAQFKINASLIGVIAGHNGDLHIGTGACGVRFLDGDPSISPYNPTTGANVDNSISLGRSNVRYTVVYATTGAINTSDRNLKQDIEELSDAEKRVAVAAKGLLRKFRWKDAVETKGDNARIHFGIIAQDLQDAFTAEGLDAARYGMWCSDTFTDEDTGEERTRLGVRYSELLAFIISAL